MAASYYSLNLKVESWSRRRKKKDSKSFFIVCACVHILGSAKSIVCSDLDLNPTALNFTCDCALYTVWVAVVVDWFSSSHLISVWRLCVWLISRRQQQLLAERRDCCCNIVNLGRWRRNHHHHGTAYRHRVMTVTFDDGDVNRLDLLRYLPSKLAG